MRIFTRVVELEGFTRAAQSLRLPKASVSTIVANLEAELGVRLLNRTTRHVSVTPDGAAYYERVVRILTEIEETEAGLRRATTAPKGKLRVDLPVSVARWVVMPALPQFIEKYPDLELQIGATDRPVDLLEEGVDCVVRGGAQADSSLIGRRIGELPLVRCASPVYLDRHGRPSSLQDLAQHRAIHYFSSRTGRRFEHDYVDEAGQPQPIAIASALSVNDIDVLLIAALAGLGIAEMPALYAQRYTASGELELVLPAYVPAPVPLFVMYPQNRHLSAKVRVFADWIAELFQTSDLFNLRSALPPHGVGKQN
jgi:LysR family transcriptional regulator, regulator for bpeEF and oprC